MTYEPAHTRLSLNTLVRRVARFIPRRGALVLPVDLEALKTSVGRVQWTDDIATAGVLEGLASLLDHTKPPWVPGELPPLAHWLYFVPRDLQSSLDPDGHPKRGGFLPLVPLPRRMWVGSRVRFFARIGVGSTMRRRSTISQLTAKNGRSGQLIFVTVTHEITSGDAVAIVEEQDLVFRAAAVPGKTSDEKATRQIPRSPDATRSFVPDPVQLFRFSALSFNAHRIHYDRDYAIQVEGYDGLVVHAPFIATLLMDHYLNRSCDSSVRAFSFRAERPLFNSAPFDLCIARNAIGAELWAVDTKGAVAMSATVECERR
jgi:3-methylfumaryl-CoA hydratase